MPTSLFLAGVTLAAMALTAAAPADAADIPDAAMPVAAPAVSLPYVEFNVHDAARAKTFYRAVFGWAFTDYGPDYTSFAADGLTGGFMKAEPTGAGGPLMVFHAADLEGTLARVKASGGTILKPIFAYPGGRRFHFRDLDGYEVAAWSEPKP